MPITVTPGTAPPIADLFLSSLPADTAVVAVWRMWADRESRVRGDDKTVVVGTETRLVDYDIPVGQPVSYRAQCFAGDGSELDPLAPTTPVTIDLDDVSTCWLSDPLAPALARLVVIDGATDTSRTYSADVVYAAVMGYNDPTAISGIRASAADWTFTLKSYSHEESTAIEALVMGGGTLLIRAYPSVIRHATGLIYLSAPTVTELPRWDIAYQEGRADWVLTGRQTRPPGLNIVMPLREYQDVLDENVDYADIVAKYPDYLALLRG